MSNLFRRATVFMEVQNVLMSYDAIVASRIDKYLKTNKGAATFFKPELRELSKIPVEELVFSIMADKKQRNFLIDYFDWSKVEMSPEVVDPMKICEKVYSEALNMPIEEGDVLANEDITPLTTSIGKSFQVLLNDQNMNDLHLFVGMRVPWEISKGIAKLYNGSVKCHYWKCSQAYLKDFFDQHICDSYFFEESTSIDKFIAKKHPELSEVLVPGNHVNLSVVDSIESTQLRNIILDKPLDYYKDKLNLDIHSMTLPI